MTDASFRRALPLSGASNFRDLGRYSTRDGRAVRDHTLFRSDHLASLDAQDQQALQALGLARSFDFRGVQERAATGYELPGLNQHHLPIEPTVVQAMQSLLEAGRSITARDTVELMRETYRNFVLHNSDRFAELFEHLLQTDTPLVFHCTAGKDRTGFAASLILHALNVPQDTILQDYLLTNQHYRMPVRTDHRVPMEVLEVLWRVQEDFLRASYEAIEADYGTVDVYLRERLGLRPDALQHLQQVYLTQAPAA